MDAGTTLAPPGADLGALLDEVVRSSNATPATCVEVSRRALAAARAAGDTHVEMQVLHHVGIAHHLLSEDHEALEALERALRLAEQHGDRPWKARVLGGLGATHSGFGDNATAIELLEQSLDIRRELEDTPGIAQALNNLGMTFEEMGLFPERTRQMLLEAHAQFTELGNDHGCCTALSHLASLDIRVADQTAAEDPELARLAASEALRNARRAVAHARRLDNPRLLGETLVREGRALVACGLTDEAEAVLDQAAALADSIDTSHFRLRLTATRARLHRARGDQHEAVDEVERGLAICDGMLRTAERVELLTELVAVHEERGAYREALETHRALLAATLQHRDEGAERRARTINARLDVERARVAAEVERLRSEQLELANRELEHKASHDALTGLANRRAFDATLEARTAGPDTTVTCLLGDLDNFKTVNDRFSHPVGDEVLRRVARLVQAAVRGTDLVARIGGEELAVLLTDTPSAAEVAAVSERIRHAVEQHPWHEVVPGLVVTISLGAATRRPAEPAESLVARADALLYTAKCAGRNRVATDEPPVPDPSRPGVGSAAHGTGDVRAAGAPASVAATV